MLRSRLKYPLLTQMNPKSPVTESYRTLRTNMQYAASGLTQTIVIASAQMGEGKSMTTANLGVACALDDRKVLIIDADMRKPTMHHIFQKTNRVGLSGVLAGGVPVIEAIRETDIPNLSVLTAGGEPANAAELLSSKAMTRMLAELRETYDLILIDSPPAVAAADAQILASKTDALLLVIQSGKVKRKVLQKVKASFEFVGARILGVVLNNVNRNEEHYYYYGKRFG